MKVQLQVQGHGQERGQPGGTDDDDEQQDSDEKEAAGEEEGGRRRKKEGWSTHHCLFKTRTRSQGELEKNTK